MRVSYADASAHQEGVDGGSRIRDMGMEIRDMAERWQSTLYVRQR